MKISVSFRDVGCCCCAYNDLQININFVVVVVIVDIYSSILFFDYFSYNFFFFLGKRHGATMSLFINSLTHSLHFTSLYFTLLYYHKYIVCIPFLAVVVISSFGFWAIRCTLNSWSWVPIPIWFSE